MESQSYTCSCIAHKKNSINKTSDCIGRRFKKTMWFEFVFVFGIPFMSSAYNKHWFDLIPAVTISFYNKLLIIDITHVIITFFSFYQGLITLVLMYTPRAYLKGRLGSPWDCDNKGKRNWRKVFVVLTRAWDKEITLSPHEESNHRP